MFLRFENEGGKIIELNGTIDGVYFRGTGKIISDTDTIYFAQFPPFAYMTTDKKRFDTLVDPKKGFKWKLRTNVRKSKYKKNYPEGAWIVSQASVEPSEDQIVFVIPNFKRTRFENFKGIIRRCPLAYVYYDGETVKIITRKGNTKNVYETRALEFRP